MKMMKKLLCFALSVILCFSVIGCKDNEEPPVPYDPNEDVLDDEKQYDITFYGWGDAEEIANYEVLIEQFMLENPNINVTYTSDNASTYNQNLVKKAKNLPDVFYVPDTEFMYWASSNKLLDITSAFTEEELSKLWPEALDKYYYNTSTGLAGKENGGKLYGLPKDLGPFPLVYNKTLLNELAAKYNLTDADLACIDPENPMSWDQFRTLLKKLSPGEVEPQQGQEEKVFGLSHYPLDTAVYSNNADYFNADQSEQRITEKNFSDAVQFIADLCLVDKVMPNPDQQQSTNGYQRFFASGTVFSFMGPWDLAAFWSSVNFDFDILPVPYGPAEGAVSTSWVGSMSYSVSQKAYTEGRASAALKFAKYLCYNVEAQRKFYELGQQVPNIVDMAKNEYVNNSENILTGKKLMPEHREVFVNIISNENPKMAGKARATYYTYESLWYTDLEESLETVWRGTKKADEFCASYAPTLNGALMEMIYSYRS